MNHKSHTCRSSKYTVGNGTMVIFSGLKVLQMITAYITAAVYKTYYTEFPFWLETRICFLWDLYHGAKVLHLIYIYSCEMLLKKKSRQTRFGGLPDLF